MKKEEMQETIELQRKQLDTFNRLYPERPTIISAGYKQYFCAECGGPFLLNEGQVEKKFKNTFYCSAGHKNIFTNK
jgi:hypothetical protein